MKLQPLCLAAALLASPAVAAEVKKEEKPATKPAPAQPAAKPTLLPSRPAPFTPPPVTKPAPTPTYTIPNAVNRLRSNPYEVNTAPRTSPFVGAAQGGAKRDLDRITKTGGSTQVFDGGRGSTINTGVRPNPVVVPPSAPRTTTQPTTVSPYYPRTTPPSPPVSAPSNSPSLREKLKNWLR